MIPILFKRSGGSPRLLACGALILLGGCARREPPGWQGYLEGEFVYVASPISGQLQKLAVQRGSRVDPGTTLFVLESAAEGAARAQAAAESEASDAKLADLRKGLRPTEIAALAARLEQARAAEELSRIDFERQANLYRDRAVALSDYDRARLTHEENVRAVKDLSAQLATARLGGRSDAVAAAEGDARAAHAALDRADWSVEQKTQAAPCAALVYDTLYREGEFVAAGIPVVSLLPPANIKVRFFVPEGDLAGLKAGDRVRISVTGLPQPLEARVSYLSPQPEYTPPVLYNRENRAKLTFMIEARFENAEAARDLHPGQPADVAPEP
jgi:HlyD family secretion protein